MSNRPDSPNGHSPTLIGALQAAAGDWASLVRAVILIASVFASAGIFASCLLPLLAPSGMQLTIPGGTTIAFKGRGEQVEFYSVLVDAHGWTDSGVDVRGGDEIAFTASGSVQLAQARLIEAFQRMTDIKKGNKASFGSRAITRFSEQQLKESLTAYPWASPLGFSDSEIRFEEAHQSAEEIIPTRVVPDARLGQLIAIIAPGGQCPARRSIPPSGPQPYLYVGSPTMIFSSGAGKLCFIVNDNSVPPDSVGGLAELQEEVLWQDNSGFYSVRVRTRRSAS